MWCLCNDGNQRHSFQAEATVYIFDDKVRETADDSIAPVSQGPAFEVQELELRGTSS